GHREKGRDQADGVDHHEQRNQRGHEIFERHGCRGPRRVSHKTMAEGSLASTGKPRKTVRDAQAAVAIGGNRFDPPPAVRRVPAIITMFTFALTRAAATAKPLPDFRVLCQKYYSRIGF